MCITNTGNDGFEATISLNEVHNLSDAEIVHALFIIYLEHYKTKSLLDDAKIIDYKDIKVREVQGIADKTIFSVGYSVQQNFWGSYWAAGNGYFGENGWKFNKSCYVKLIKEKEQYRLEMHGTGL